VTPCDLAVLHRLSEYPVASIFWVTTILNLLMEAERSRKQHTSTSVHGITSHKTLTFVIEEFILYSFLIIKGLLTMIARVSSVDNWPSP
jgi:hypothetical protein